jgi:hypothetical protein
MDERARKILADAWDAVERVDAMLANMPTRAPYDPYAPKEREAVVHRTRGLDTDPEEQLRNNYAPADKAAADTSWNAWFDQRFRQLFAAECSDAIIEITFKRMDRHRKELQAEVAALRQELALLRAVRDGGNVLELKKSDVA